jgi:hypothetical protein
VNGPATGGFGQALPVPGEIIAAKYEVVRVLGEGGMGVVILARHVQLGHEVAIKFMHGLARPDPTAIERFLREARAVVALSSEHVARVVDVGTLESGAPYMVMEYLAGRDFGEVLQKGGAMAIPDAVDSLLQACDAIAEAHALGIVHRDLKPSNLFVTTRRDGTRLVKVLDFGISKSTELVSGAAGNALTSSGTVMGSPGYMSPEQVRSTKSVDVRSDVWSLGVILYEFLTGVSPFVGDTIGETFARILSEPPAALRRRRPDVPATLEALIFRCLERDLGRRMPSVVELARQLVPFGSREAAITAERILRMAAPRPPTGSETVLAPGADGTAVPQRAETAPAWLQSGSAAHVAGRTRMQAWVVAAVAVVLVAAGVLGLRGAKSTTTAVDGGRAEPSASGPPAPSRAVASIEEAAPSTASPAPSLRDVVGDPRGATVAGALPESPPGAQPPPREEALPVRPKPHAPPKTRAPAVSSGATQAPASVPDFGY